MNLIEALQKKYPDSSRRTLQNWIKWGRVAVDGDIAKQANHPITPDQQVTVATKIKYVNNIPILYEDRYCLIIDKPAGLLSVPAENTASSALSLLGDIYSLHAVHRIDQDTSGTLLFARGTVSQEKFDVLFEEHSMQREYLAIVEGHIAQQQGTWMSFLREKENFDVEVTTPEQGKRAVTHYEVIGYSKRLSFLRLRLETGRKHQIRVHCKEAGHPILGDRRYGSLSKGRLCLHARCISFTHPFTKKAICITAPLPYKMEKLFQR